MILWSKRLNKKSFSPRRLRKICLIQTGLLLSWAHSSLSHFFLFLSDSYIPASWNGSASLRQTLRRDTCRVPPQTWPLSTRYRPQEATPVHCLRKTKTLVCRTVTLNTSKQVCYERKLQLRVYNHLRRIYLNQDRFMSMLYCWEQSFVSVHTGTKITVLKC